MRTPKRSFFAIVLDTIQDATKKDQLSEVFRYIKIDYNEDETPLELKVVEAFTSFTEVEDSSAQTNNEFHSAERV